MAYRISIIRTSAWKWEITYILNFLSGLCHTRYFEIRELKFNDWGSIGCDMSYTCVYGLGNKFRKCQNKGKHRSYKIHRSRLGMKGFGRIPEWRYSLSVQLGKMCVVTHLIQRSACHERWRAGKGRKFWRGRLHSVWLLPFENKDIFEL